MSLTKDTFCSYCGKEFELNEWPKYCHHCKNTTFQNPIPVAVMVIPTSWGILCIKRGTPPIGELALIGGYIEKREDWKDAAVREVYEEIGLQLNRDDISLHRIITTENNIVIFGILDYIENYSSLIKNFRPTSEALELVEISSPIQLAFPSHTIVLKDLLTKR